MPLFSDRCYINSHFSLSLNRDIFSCRTHVCLRCPLPFRVRLPFPLSLSPLPIGPQGSTPSLFSMKERGGEGEKQRGRRAFIVHFKAPLLPPSDPPPTRRYCTILPSFSRRQSWHFPLTQLAQKEEGEKRRGRKRRCEQSISARRKESRGVWNWHNSKKVFMGNSMTFALPG